MVICCIVWLFNMYLICYCKSPMRSRTRAVSPGPSRCPEISDPPSIFVEWFNFWESGRAYVLPMESLQWYCDMIVICPFLMQEKNKAQSVLTECLLKMFLQNVCMEYSKCFLSHSLQWSFLHPKGKTIDSLVLVCSKTWILKREPLRTQTWVF